MQIILVRQVRSCSGLRRVAEALEVFSVYGTCLTATKQCPLDAPSHHIQRCNQSGPPKGPPWTLQPYIFLTPVVCPLPRAPGLITRCLDFRPVCRCTSDERTPQNARCASVSPIPSRCWQSILYKKYVRDQDHDGRKDQSSTGGQANTSCRTKAFGLFAVLRSFPHLTIIWGPGEWTSGLHLHNPVPYSTSFPTSSPPSCRSWQDYRSRLHLSHPQRPRRAPSRQPRP
jgi:hypothetical protein